MRWSKLWSALESGASLESMQESVEQRKAFWQKARAGHTPTHAAARKKYYGHEDKPLAG